MPRIAAVFSYRYDAQLVPDLVKNLSFVDEVVSYDDRANDARWYHEGDMRRSMLDRARAAGADWALCVDPDERFERGAGKAIRSLVDEAADRDVIFSFPFRELWTPNDYRVDGVWGKKRKKILFPLRDGQEFMNLPVHSPWHPTNAEYETVLTDINLYHLKTIVPANRQARADLYNSLDPDRQIQRIGYDYLADESGRELERIPFGRGYRPKYRESYRIVQTVDA